MKKRIRVDVELETDQILDIIDYLKDSLERFFKWQGSIRVIDNVKISIKLGVKSEPF